MGSPWPGSRGWGCGAHPSWCAWWLPTPASGGRPVGRSPRTWAWCSREDSMRLFDPHIHMTSRTTDDYQAMADAGIAAIVEPAFWVGQPRTNVGTFEDYFLSLLGWERFRALQFGIRHFATLALNPKEANNPNLADGVLAMLPRYLDKDGVVAIGEIGFDDQTDAEDRVFRRQVELAREYELP